jgi:hypothetical protein
MESDIAFFSLNLFYLSSLKIQNLLKNTAFFSLKIQPKNKEKWTKSSFFVIINKY